MSRPTYLPLTWRVMTSVICQLTAPRNLPHRPRRHSWPCLVLDLNCLVKHCLVTHAHATSVTAITCPTLSARFLTRLFSNTLTPHSTPRPRRHSWPCPLHELVPRLGQWLRTHSHATCVTPSRTTRNDRVMTRIKCEF